MFVQVRASECSMSRIEDCRPAELKGYGKRNSGVREEETRRVVGGERVSIKVCEVKRRKEEKVNYHLLFSLIY